MTMEIKFTRRNRILINGRNLDLYWTHAGTKFYAYKGYQAFTSAYSLDQLGNALSADKGIAASAKLIESDAKKRSKSKKNPKHVSKEALVEAYTI